MSSGARAVFDRGDDELARAVAEQEDPTGYAASAKWLWLLDGTALPQPDTLQRLLAAAYRLEPDTRPILLSSNVVNADRRPAAEHVPIMPQDKVARAMVTIAERVLEVRAVAGGSLLVRADAFSDPLPRGVVATTTRTARALREARGFLVPDSIARVRVTAGDRRARLHLAVRLLSSSALSARERLRFAAALVERPASQSA